MLKICFQYHFTTSTLQVKKSDFNENEDIKQFESNLSANNIFNASKTLDSRGLKRF